MTQANKEQIAALAEMHPMHPEKNVGYACYKYALAATLGVYISSNETELPSIWSVQTPNGVHAYLEHQGIIYNEGITWPDATYPSYDFQTIQEIGVNDTLRILFFAFQEFTGEPFEGRNIEANDVLTRLDYPKEELTMILVHALSAEYDRTAGEEEVQTRLESLKP